MNRSLKLVLLAATATGMVAVALAQTPPATAPAGAPAAPAPAVSPERFEPTDKVRADFDVSFPIDI